VGKGVNALCMLYRHQCNVVLCLQARLYSFCFLLWIRPVWPT